MISVEEILEGKVFLIDKPLDWTSFDVVNKIRWNIRKAYNLKKIKVGHAGTLDPKATGLLIICTGKFTKRIDEIQAESKVYTGTIKLGVTTPTYDTESEEDQVYPTAHITEELIHQTTEKFIGEIDQFPPAHSAVKVDGKRLYELARAGKEVELKPRQIKIYDFKITKIEMPFVEFEVHCGKGTYIRSLANDFGKALDSGGYLTELRRTKIGEFSVENAENGALEKKFFEE
ncbi:tRNA pseudouridine(55) synthase TruB [Moheibacter lacus]|uniref:tRNA pseudouridine synthase B n=1 Tax=Moheibacter lacus TaxID=2745851 RepID=A0A838ZT73_9FLAO|nr:tRNA pseudouridine(55) synthase TruB [Moheibacter lacus]MBA5630181.1 tRNA pseudouridine(55) synthase TruB [Moheibacter lacus]